MSDGTFTCYNCGRVGYGEAKGGGLFYDPQGWKYNKMMGFGRHIFCSDRCLKEFKSSNGEQSNSDGDGILKTAIKGAVRGKTAEEKIAESQENIARIESEAEYKRYQHELKLRNLDEKKEKRLKREQKADELRAKKRPIAGLLAQYQPTVIVFTIILIYVAIISISTIYVPIIIAAVIGGFAFLYFQEKNSSNV